MNEQDDIELIESHLFGRLTEEEARKVNLRMREDKAFLKLYEETQKLILGVRKASRREIIGLLDDMDKRNFNELKIQNTKPLIQKLVVAATVLVILSFGFYWYKYQTISVNQIIFDEYFRPFPNQIIPTTRSTELPKKPKEKAYYQYDLGNYKRAVLLLEVIPKSEDDYSSLLYLAVGNLAINKPKLAIDYLKEYLSEKRLFYEDALWYLFLGYILDNQKDQAKSTSQLMSVQSQYYKSAISIMNEIEL